MRMDCVTALACVVVWSSICTGCGPSTARTTRVNYGNGIKVSGVVTYRERFALPDGTVVTARLVDVTDAGSPTVLCEQIISHPGQVPVPFVLSVAPNRIDQNRNYAIDAEIKLDGQVRWRTAQQYGVISRGNPMNGLMIWVQQTDS